MTFKLSETSKKNTVGIDPELIEIVNYAIRITSIDFGIPNTGGLRTTEQQKELYRTGKSKADGVKRKSRHQSGKAIDFYAYVHGRASWKSEHLSLVACAFLQAASMLGYSVQWGGHWRSFKDMPHIQKVD